MVWEKGAWMGVGSGPVRAAVFSLTFSLAFSGCLQNNNSFSNDAGTFSVMSGSEDFLVVKEVLRQNCMNCHPSFMQLQEKDFMGTGSVSGRALVA